MKKRIVLTLLSSISIAALTQGCAVWSDSTDNISALFAKSDKGLLTLSDYERGKHYIAVGDYGLAVESFNSALAKDPKSVPALNGLAIAYDRIGREDLALNLFAKALELEPLSPNTLNNLAYLHLSHGEKDEAATYLARAKEALAATPPNDASVKLQAVVNNNATLMVAKNGVDATARSQLGFSEQRAAPAQAAASNDRILRGNSTPAEQSSAALRAAMSVTRTPLAEPAAGPQLVESQIWNLEVNGTEPKLVPPSTPDGRGNANSAAPPGPLTAAANHPADKLSTKAFPMGTAFASAIAMEPIEARGSGTRTIAPIASAPAFPRQVTVRIANLTNRHNMAHRFQHYFDALGVPVRHLVNKAGAERQESAIYYSRGQEKAAEALARLLPISVQTIGLSNDFGVVELMLAPDLEPFDRSLVVRRSS